MSTSPFLFRLVYRSTQHYTVNVRETGARLGDVCAVSTGSHRWFYLLDGETADGTPRQAFRTRIEATYALRLAYIERLRERLTTVAEQHIADLDARPTVSLVKDPVESSHTVRLAKATVPRPVKLKVSLVKAHAA